eukprot:g5434.t1
MTLHSLRRMAESTVDAASGSKQETEEKEEKMFVESENMKLL